MVLQSLSETRAGEGVGPGVLSLRPLPSAAPPADYAEALINPIKHVSLMDQRAKQLAALIGESEVSQGRSGAGIVMPGGVCLPELLTGRRQQGSGSPGPWGSGWGSGQS